MGFVAWKDQIFMWENFSCRSWQWILFVALIGRSESLSSHFRWQIKIIPGNAGLDNEKKKNVIKCRCTGWRVMTKKQNFTLFAFTLSVIKIQFMVIKDVDVRSPRIKNFLRLFSLRSRKSVEHCMRFQALRGLIWPRLNALFCCTVNNVHRFY